MEKQFRQVTERYTDGHDGRCAIEVILSYYGWNGKDDAYHHLWLDPKKVHSHRLP